MDAAFQAIESELGRVEVLVYNVGGGSWPPPTVEDTSVDMFRKGLEVNAVGAFMWVKKVGDATSGSSAKAQGLDKECMCQ